MIPITLPLLMALEIRSVRLVTRLTAALITIIGHKKQAYKVSPTEDHDPLSLTTTHRSSKYEARLCRLRFLCEHRKQTVSPSSSAVLITVSGGYDSPTEDHDPLSLTTTHRI
jgi:hypothetical protein